MVDPIREAALSLCKAVEFTGAAGTWPQVYDANRALRAALAAEPVDHEAPPVTREGLAHILYDLTLRSWCLDKPGRHPGYVSAPESVKKTYREQADFVLARF